ncbi:MAG: PIN domain-containing protein [Nitrospira sp. LK70]|nr:PIN domain-containing protein [Nitrospira sp. LK70]
MKERVFLDTNVLVYLFDADNPTKQRRVQDLLSSRELRAQVTLSTQVLQEFYVSVTRKLATPLGLEAAFQAVQDLTAFPIVQIDTPLILLAIQRSGQAKVSFWDALILEAALVAGATVLYSEDFQDGAVFGGLRVMNPFKLSV